MNRAQIIQENVNICLSFGKHVLTPGEFKFVGKFTTDGTQFTELRPYIRDKGKDSERLSFFPVKISGGDLDPKVFNKLARLALKVKQMNRISELRA